MSHYTSVSAHNHTVQIRESPSDVIHGPPPPPAHPRRLQICSFLVVYSPPLGMQIETFPHHRIPDRPYKGIFWVPLFGINIAFRKIAKRDILKFS